MLIPLENGSAGVQVQPNASLNSSATLSELSHRIHQHLSLARDAQASNQALQALLEHARSASGASGFAGVTQQLVDTNKKLQEYTANVGEAGPGFALCNQGPEIPWNVSDANIEALVRAAHRTRLRAA